jgi:hypothetical protein
MENALPGGHDLVLAANIVHYLLPRQAVDVAARIRAAGEPGARLLLSTGARACSTVRAPVPCAARSTLAVQVPLPRAGGHGLRDLECCRGEAA